MPEQIQFPVGRIVQGSVYTGSSRDIDGNPLVYKNGPNAGQPMTRYYFAVGIPKATGETSWTQTVWGRTIQSLARTAFAQGQSERPDFSWKIEDGDSQIPNKVGRKNIDREGFPGNWIVKFSTTLPAPVYISEKGRWVQEPTDQPRAKPGNFVQVVATVNDNKPSQSPGMYINPNKIAFVAYGQEIVFDQDPNDIVGFGQGALPPGASATPIGAAPSAAHQQAAPPVHQQQAAPTPPVSPNHSFPGGPGAAPPPPTAPVHQMLPPANGVSYEQMIAAGWTDAQLVQHGMMAP